MTYHNKWAFSCLHLSSYNDRSCKSNAEWRL